MSSSNGATSGRSSTVSPKQFNGGYGDEEHVSIRDTVYPDFGFRQHCRDPHSIRATASETYSWHGELVAVDSTAKTITVRSMVVGSAVEELGRFKAGDRVMLGWTGFDKYANAVNHAVRYDATKKSDERFAFPAEFVSF